MEAFIKAPRQGEVYNIGGGKANAVSMLEAFQLAESLTGKPMNWSYSEVNRIGDHICYYSDLSKMRIHYPNWDITIDLETMFQEMIDNWDQRLLS
jgi:CDP-paratose 2-epimerase